MTTKLNHYLVDDLSRLGEIGLECLSTSTSVNCTEVPPPRVCMISPCNEKEGGMGEREEEGRDKGECTHIHHIRYSYSKCATLSTTSDCKLMCNTQYTTQ